MSIEMHSTPENLKPAKGELPVNDKPIARLGYAILFVTFGLFGGWAMLAPLDSAALAPGQVTVKGYRKTVQHLEGGIIRELKVRDGDQVQAGDVLLVLDDTQARAELEMVRSQLIASAAAEARLIAERDWLDELPPVASLAPEDPRVQEAIASEMRIFNSRRNSLLGETAILEKTVVQLEEQIRGFRTIVQNKKQLATSYTEEIGDLKSLLEEGFVDNQRLREQERNHSRLVAEIAEHESAAAQAKLRIAETELQIIQLRKTFASEVATQLGDTQTKIYDLRERLAAVQDRLQRTTIRAPESGMVIGMAVHTVGGVVSPATALLDIVPASEDLIIEARISPMDIDRVAVGKTADIRFSAFKSATTPVVKATLVHVSGDALADQESGAQFYLGRLELTPEGRKMLGDLVLVPGMPAEVLINTGERTLFDYLVQPATNAFARSMIED